MIPVLELTRPLVLTDTPGIVAETVDGWTRPLDWLPLPDVTSADDKFVGLYAVFEHGRNKVAFRATVSGAATYTVDWGDGTVETVASTVVAEHTYDYATLPASSLSARGYKQAVITATPGSGGVFTVFALNARPTGERAAQINANWLDIVASLPSVTTFGNFMGATTIGSRLVERIDLRHTTAVATSLVSLVHACIRLQVFRYAGSVENVTTMSSMFNSCRSIHSIVVNGITAKTTNLSNFAPSCDSLVSLTLGGSIEGVTTLSAFANLASGLRRLVLPTGTWTALTTTSSALASCTSLQIIEGTPPNISFTIDGNMDQSQLEDVLDALLTVSSETITITGNPGAAAAAAGASGTAAVAKGWTIVA